MTNHWTSDVDFVVEEKTLFRLVGWRCDSGCLHHVRQPPAEWPQPDSFAPVYVQSATWENDGWKAVASDMSAIEVERARLRDLVQRFSQWDMLDTAADGPYWKREIAAVLGSQEESP